MTKDDRNMWAIFVCVSMLLGMLTMAAFWNVNQLNKLPYIKIHLGISAFYMLMCYLAVVNNKK